MGRQRGRPTALQIFTDRTQFLLLPINNLIKYFSTIYAELPGNSPLNQQCSFKMNCLLCSSSDCHRDGENNSLWDHGMSSAKKVSESLCLLLGLPPNPFEDNFLQSNISYCTTCIRTLERICTLFEDLESLQAKITESKIHVEMMIHKSLQINQNRANVCSSPVEIQGPISTEDLRLEIGKALHLASVAEKDGMPEVPDAHKVVLSEGFILGDYFKDEVLSDADWNSAPSPIPSEIECDPVRVTNKLEVQVNANPSPTISHPRPRLKRNKITARPSPLAEFCNRTLKVGLTRLSEDDIRRLRSRGQGSSSRADRPRRIRKDIDYEYFPPSEKQSRRRDGDDENPNLNSKSTESSQSSLGVIPPKKKRRPRGTGIKSMPKIIPCTFQDCDEKFRNELSRRYHLRKVHCTVPVRVFTCDLCSKKFPYAGKLEVHQRSHTGELPFKCSYCSKSFRGLEFVRRHEKVHNGGRKFSCTSCPMVFISRAALRAHSLVHTDTREFICELCTCAFKRKIELVDHQTNVHHKELNLTPNKCRHCGKILLSQCYLKIHERAHDGDLPFKCPHCPISCDRPSRLEKHLLVHTNEKSFVCEHCGKSYKYKNALDLHMMDHTGIRPFQCKQCPKMFKDKNHLRRHEALHSGLKPIKCVLCGEGFPLRKYLNRHLLKHKTGRIPTLAPPTTDIIAPLEPE